MKKYQLTSVTSPSIDFEIGDHKITSTVIKSLKRNPNFDQPLFFFDVVCGLFWGLFVCCCFLWGFFLGGGSHFRPQIFFHLNQNDN